MTEVVTIIRVLEYTGTKEEIALHLQQRAVVGGGFSHPFIRETFLVDENIPEILGISDRLRDAAHVALQERKVHEGS